MWQARTNMILREMCYHIHAAQGRPASRALEALWSVYMETVVGTWKCDSVPGCHDSFDAVDAQTQYSYAAAFQYKGSCTHLITVCLKISSRSAPTPRTHTRRGGSRPRMRASSPRRTLTAGTLRTCLLQGESRRYAHMIIAEGRAVRAPPRARSTPN